MGGNDKMASAANFPKKRAGVSRELGRCDPLRNVFSKFVDKRGRSVAANHNGDDFGRNLTETVRVM
jgi:hypothetical protein